MGRTVAVVWHASFSIAAGFLYFFFVLPRWQELLGDTSTTLGTVLRIVTGALIALAALPVVFTLQRTRKPEYGSPQLALSLRTWSIVGHVLSGVLIIGTAISEIWLNLDSAGQWLFGSYGAAAAIAILGIFGFYLAFVAELPPPPPRPIRSKDGKKSRGGRKRAKESDEPTDEAESDDEVATDATADDETPAEDEADEAPAEDEVADEEPAEVTADADAPADEKEQKDASAKEDADEDDALAPAGGLRNRRPSGKVRLRRRTRGAASKSVD